MDNDIVAERNNIENKCSNKTDKTSESDKYNLTDIVIPLNGNNEGNNSLSLKEVINMPLRNKWDYGTFKYTDTSGWEPEVLGSLISTGDFLRTYGSTIDVNCRYRKKCEYWYFKEDLIPNVDAIKKKYDNCRLFELSYYGLSGDIILNLFLEIFSDMADCSKYILGIRYISHFDIEKSCLRVWVLNLDAVPEIQRLLCTITNILPNQRELHELEKWREKRKNMKEMYEKNTQQNDRYFQMENDDHHNDESNEYGDDNEDDDEDNENEIPSYYRENENLVHNFRPRYDNSNRRQYTWNNNKKMDTPRHNTFTSRSFKYDKRRTGNGIHHW